VASTFAMVLAFDSLSFSSIGVFATVLAFDSLNLSSIGV
jgi:hypothetical protein